MSILNVEHVSHGFGARTIFEDVSFRLVKGSTWLWWGQTARERAPSFPLSPAGSSLTRARSSGPGGSRWVIWISTAS